MMAFPSTAESAAPMQGFSIGHAPLRMSAESRVLYIVLPRCAGALIECDTTVTPR
jgi:hypothetical protein